MKLTMHTPAPLATVAALMSAVGAVFPTSKLTGNGVVEVPDDVAIVHPLDDHLELQELVLDQLHDAVAHIADLYDHMNPFMGVSDVELAQRCHLAANLAVIVLLGGHQ